MAEIDQRGLQEHRVRERVRLRGHFLYPFPRALEMRVRLFVPIKSTEQKASDERRAQGQTRKRSASCLYNTNPKRTLWASDD